jgi:predicted RNA binding protein YcfA (HicA-like mRNA interferase family)
MKRAQMYRAPGVTVAGNLGVDLPPGTSSSILKQAGLKHPEGDD